MSLRFDRSSTKVLWTTRRHQPTFLRLPWLRIEPVIARRLFNQVERDFWGDQFYVDQLFGLCSQDLIAYEVQSLQRLDLVRQWIGQGRIIAWREAPPFTGPSAGDQPVDSALLAPLYRSYAKEIGMDSGTVVAPPSEGSGHKPIIPAAADVPTGERGKALPNATNESCPENNWRSESHLTAKPEVVAWLKNIEGKLEAFEQDEVLGREGGGGFLSTTTRISRLSKGTLIYRYYDTSGNASNSGGWWSTDLVMGDPRQTLALPPAKDGWSNSAKDLARARIAFDVPALTGLGAPRCSNKPGGPQQWYIALADRKRNVLCHPDDSTKPFPRE